MYEVANCDLIAVNFYSGHCAALYNDDVDKAYEEIDNFEEETETTIEDNTATSEVESEITSETETSGGTTSDTSEDLVDGMRPSFKEAMDSYEAFYDEYCEFMKEYMENPSGEIQRKRVKGNRQTLFF